MGDQIQDTGRQSRYAKIAPIGSRNAVRVGSVRTAGLAIEQTRKTSNGSRVDRSHAVEANTRTSLDKKSKQEFSLS